MTNIRNPRSPEKPASKLKSPTKKRENLPDFDVDPDFRTFGDEKLGELRKLEVELRLEISFLSQELTQLYKVNEQKRRKKRSDPPLLNEEEGIPAISEISVPTEAEVSRATSTDLVPSGVNGETREIASFVAPPHCIPIKANVQNFDWKSLYQATQFDVILIDPPWQLAQPAPTRGVAIAYSQLTDAHIQKLPLNELANKDTGCWLFIWVINAKYATSFELMSNWGFDYVDDVTWVKTTVNRKLAKGHGHYLQHAKESCLVGRLGQKGGQSVGEDVIFATRKGQSQKPGELYDLIEKLVPNGKYIEIFGRRNNLRNYWVTIGNEL